MTSLSCCSDLAGGHFRRHLHLTRFRPDLGHVRVFDDRHDHVGHVRCHVLVADTAERRLAGKPRHGKFRNISPFLLQLEASCIKLDDLVVVYAVIVITSLYLFVLVQTICFLLLL